MSKVGDNPASSAAGNVLALSVLKAVFLINGCPINVGKQPAFCLGQVQVDGAGLAGGDQKLADLVHLNARLMFGRKLLKRNQRRRQRFRDNPFVVTCDSFSRHSGRPFRVAPYMLKAALVTGCRNVSVPITVPVRV